ncbi:MAG: ATP-binding protein [Candidatus Limisoma sp.]|nr:ATP-binding protein [Bacteroidales bacterium]MDD7760006.1 ATP-binding protein [Bacteroidales bacterium]MDY5893615.1 ATP-binding protein [Candidatus Limisoma sp.]MDY5999258.1 ATP-binding protein [Candidatus Limisoma sp.]
MIERILSKKISALLDGRKAITIMGARQVGKSTLLQMMLGERKDVMWLNGDEPDIVEILGNMTSPRLKAMIGNNTIIVIDEAQRIPDIGLRLKLITDQIPDVQVIATGSSSFDLSNKLNEPLTGRKREFKMYPLTFNEMVSSTNLLEETRMLPHRMVYGYYPEVVCNPGEEKIILKELADSYLYKDILSMDGILKPEKLVKLLKALAYQIGSQVSYNEVGMLVGLDSKTVEKYITILEKSYIIFRLTSLARNIRNELKSSRKIFFWDLGIRNAVIGNLTQIENRQDAGALWENFVIAERMKMLAYNGSFAQTYFWRTKQKQEIDYLEEEDGKIKAFEFKWNPNKAAAKCPDSFLTAYQNPEFKVITPRNVDEFLL